MKLFKKISWYPILIVLASLVLFVTNYKAGTNLIGWDNITPEFNIKLNLSRSFFGAWQGYRGLGYPDGMAQTANLMHTIYIYLLSLVLPQNMLRYVYIFGTHLIGGLALYYLGVRLLKNKAASCAAALFYMFNLGITQMYYAPLEAFATHFAALPVITLTLVWALARKTWKSFGVLFLVSFLLSPQGFVPTVFFVGMILWTLIVFINAIKNKEYRYSIYTFLIILAANAFWLLPYLYNGLQNAAVIQNSRINQFSSEEVFFRNRARGDLFSVLTMKGFMIDAIEYDVVNNAYVLLMNAWRSFSSHLMYYAGMVIIVALTLFGIIKSVIKKNFDMVPFILGLIISLIFLANNTPVLSWVTDLMRVAIPPLGEMFRFPFTKFITLFAFCYALLFGYGIANISKKSVHVFIVATILSIGVLTMAYPSFKGEFVSNFLKVTVPAEYSQLFKYFDTKDQNARIAYLPTQTFWNWQYRDWGYRGSDFIWHGIKQPILLRPFDPWSETNEQFYNEFSQTIKNSDTTGFQKVLSKYNISYLLIDGSVVNTLSNKQINYPQLTQFVESCTCVTNKKQFGKLTVYTVTNSHPGVYGIPTKNALTVGSSFTFASTDPINRDNANYIETQKNPDVYYPFTALSTDKLQESHDFVAVQTESKIILKPKHLDALKKFSGTSIELPFLTNSESLIPVILNQTDQGLTIELQYPEVYVNNKQVHINPETFEIPAKFVPNSITFNDLDTTVALKNNSAAGYLLNNYSNSITISNGTATQVVTINTNELNTGSYILPLDDHVSDIRIEIPKITSMLAVSNILKTPDYKISEKGSELNLFKNSSKVIVDKSSDGVDFIVKDGTGKLDYYNNSLFHTGSYILFAHTTYRSGLPMRFYVDNTQEDRSEIETIFSKKTSNNVVIIPPSDQYFKGYGFHFTVKSVGHETAKSTISKISVYEFPLRTIEQIRFLSKDNVSPAQPANLTRLPIQDQYATTEYVVSVPKKPGTIVLAQSYNSGWKGYVVKNHESRIMNQAAHIFPFIFGTKLTDHVKVNNWANGWTISDSRDKAHSEIVITYLPQYLEYVGMAISVITALFLTFKTWASRHYS